MTRRGLSLDVHGTLLHLARPVGVIWADLARRHGHTADADAVTARFRPAFKAAHARGQRQHGDGRPFWRAVVTDVLGPVDDALFEALYGHFATLADWRLADDAAEVLDALRRDGWRIAVLSNGDDRVRALVAAADLARRVDAIVLAGDVGADKPDPRAFQAAARTLGVEVADLVHVGDDPNADGAGARAAGARAFVWGVDVQDLVGLRSALR